MKFDPICISNDILDTDMKVLLDMDGVVVDFVSAAILEHGLNPVRFVNDWPKGEWDVAKVINLPPKQFWEKIDANPTFWDELQPYPWMEALTHLVHNNSRSWAFCTTPSRHHHSSAGKVRWIQNYFGKTFRDYYLCGASKAQLATPDTLLIDDSDVNVGEFLLAGGKAVLWPAVWNQSNYTIVEAMAIIEQELKG